MPAVALCSLKNDTGRGPRRLFAGLLGQGLSAREIDVLVWVTEGKTNPEIAVILGISPRTVQTHLDRIYQKLHVPTRTAAAMAAISIFNGRL